MSEQSQQNVQFYFSHETSCPYLPDRQERKIFTHLSGHKAQMHMQLLSENGFRRSQNLIYRPHCKDCLKCKSVRVRVKNFKASKSQKLIIKKNSDIVATPMQTQVGQEHFKLFKKYLLTRHNEGGMADMDFDDFKDMVEDTSVNTEIVEYRLPSNDKGKGQLLGVALIDIMFDGLSLVYSFFDPDFSKRSLGVFMIVENILRAKENKQDHVYLGYWVNGSKKMSYKTNFKPLEFYKQDEGWLELAQK